MPIREDLDLERDLTVFTVSGELCYEEIRSLLLTVYARAEYTTRSLFDMRAARAGGLASDEIRALVGLIDTHRQARAPSKWAIVAPRDVHFGLSRMFEAYAANLTVDVQAFHALEEALAWLEASQLT